MVNSDSDFNYQLGDLEKYWWIHGDYPYGFPENWAHNEEGQPSTEPVSPPPPVVKIVEAPTTSPYFLTSTIRLRPCMSAFKLESFLEDRDRQLGASDATIQELLERFASLSTYVVTLWERLQESDEKKRVLAVALFFALVAIFALLAVIVARFN